jgi:hypothetical protein
MKDNNYTTSLDLMGLGKASRSIKSGAKKVFFSFPHPARLKLVLNDLMNP